MGLPFACTTIPISLLLLPFLLINSLHCTDPDLEAAFGLNLFLHCSPHRHNCDRMNWPEMNPADIISHSEEGKELSSGMYYFSFCLNNVIDWKDKLRANDLLCTNYAFRTLVLEASGMDKLLNGVENFKRTVLAKLDSSSSPHAGSSLKSMAASPPLTGQSLVLLPSCRPPVLLTSDQLLA